MEQQVKNRYEVGLLHFDVYRYKSNSGVAVRV